MFQANQVWMLNAMDCWIRGHLRREIDGIGIWATKCQLCLTSNHSFFCGLKKEQRWRQPLSQMQIWFAVIESIYIYIYIYFDNLNDFLHHKSNDTIRIFQSQNQGDKHETKYNASSKQNKMKHIHPNQQNKQNSLDTNHLQFRMVKTKDSFRATEPASSLPNQQHQSY